MKMETPEDKLFKPDNAKSKGRGVVHRTFFEKSTPPVETTKPIISDLDNRMLYIVAAYIKKLPDNHTRKQLARDMINTIIKSANL
jgi:hypothetical protein